MRKTVFLGMAVFVALAMLAPPALAQQPPAPKVTINGLVDMVTSWTSNLSTVDLNYDRSGEREWYARTRVRPDITGEVGTTKFVLGLEIDFTWGQTGATDVSAPNRFGTTSSADLNTDLLGNIEMKWAYTEFEVPFLPKGSRLRLGAQPFAATYKLAALANGDFAGAHLTVPVAPNLRLNATYAQIEEESEGPGRGFIRGEDLAWIFSAEFTPFKGLDIRPIYSFAWFDGNTSTAARQGRGGVSVTGFSLGDGESRHTIGVDARWRSGPFYLDPTLFYQFGERERTIGGVKQSQDRSAWFLDIRGGWRAGPLLLEGAIIYTTGNTAKERVDNGRTEINFYEPISTDTSYYATWAEIWALGIDYFNIMYARASGLNPGVAIGYDKYGLIRLGARATYALTPTFSVRGGLTVNWTAEKVDTASTFASGSGLTPPAVGTERGREQYLGTELNLGFTWRFAPNVAFDMVGSYMWAGDALGYNRTVPSPGGSPDPDNVSTVVARVRYTF